MTHAGSRAAERRCCREHARPHRRVRVGADRSRPWRRALPRALPRCRRRRQLSRSTDVNRLWMTSRYLAHVSPSAANRYARRASCAVARCMRSARSLHEARQPFPRRPRFEADLTWLKNCAVQRDFRRLGSAPSCRPVGLEGSTGFARIAQWALSGTVQHWACRALHMETHDDFGSANDSARQSPHEGGQQKSHPEVAPRFRWAQLARGQASVAAIRSAQASRASGRASALAGGEAQLPPALPHKEFK
jgi:hypothetical protein